MSDSARVSDSKRSPAVQLRRLPMVAAAQSPSIWRDILLLFVAPVITLTAIFATTDPTVFEYDIAAPSLWGIYGSNLAHRSWTHLGSNIFGFLLIGGFEYLLLTAAGYRSHYLAVFGLCLLVVPLFSHLFLQFVLLQQPIFHSYEAVGFSQPIAAMTAYLPLTLTTYYHRVSNFQWPFLTALLLYAGGVAVATTQLFGLDVGTLLVATLGISGFTVVVVHLYRTTFSALERREYAFTSLAVFWLFGSGVYGLFPGTNIGSMVGHLAGFLPGFFLPLFLLWGYSLAKPSHEYALFGKHFE